MDWHKKKIVYKLWNSGLDIYILHDIYIIDIDPNWIDYLVILLNVKIFI